jgi:predicted ribosome quality control (RQC) complex YloA/Tae2 family protein|tara:strand:- start:3555 stop:3947 length:393 start_codon:yes stop_codon:yes gene_type:complete
MAEKKIKFRERIIPELGTKLLLGKNEENNDELMKQFKGKENTIIHTAAPGSPFCVIEENLKPTKQIISASGSICVGYSQDWRDNKGDVMVDVFTGKDISKNIFMKKGTWKVKHAKKLKIKKEDILKFKEK